MTPDNIQFRTGVIKPVECLKEGWALIKDQYWLFLGIVFVGVFIGSAVPIVIVMVPMYIIMFAFMMMSVPRGGGRMDPDESATFVLTLLGFYLVFIVVLLTVVIIVSIF